MADGIRTEQLRSDQARMQLEHQQEAKLKDTREKNKADLEKLVERHASVKQDLEKAFDIALSTSKEEYEKRLGEIRAANEKMLAEEKANGETEVEKVKSRYQEQISRYRQNSEKQLMDIRKDTESSAQAIKTRAQQKGQA